MCIRDSFLAQGFGQLRHGLVGVHHDGAAAFPHFDHSRVIPEAGARGIGITGVLFLDPVPVSGHVIFAVGVGGLGLEEQEPGADRAVTVLKPGGDETVFHQDHLGADFGGHGIGGAGVPYGVPGTTLAFTHRPGPEDIDHTAAGDDHGLAFEHVGLLLTHAETHRAADPVGVFLVGEQFDDEDALVDVVHPQGVLGGFGHDHLVGITVDHALPTPGADAHPAVRQPGNAFVFGDLAVHGVAFFVFFPDGQTPIFKVLHGLVDVGADAVDQVFPDDAHEVGAHHVHIVGYFVFRTDVGVDGGQTHSYRTGAIHGGFVHQGDLQPGGFRPGGSFNRGAAARHPTAYQQQIGFDGFYYGFRTKRPFTKF